MRRLNMYKTRAVRDKKGKVIHEVSQLTMSSRLEESCKARLQAKWLVSKHEQYNMPFALLQEFQSKELPNSRIQPDRRWFGNTRVVGQKQLDQFRQEMSTKVSLGLHAWHLHTYFLNACSHASETAYYQDMLSTTACTCLVNQPPHALAFEPVKQAALCFICW